MMSGSGTLPPMQYPTSSSEVTSGANMNMYALHENNDYDDSKSGKYHQKYPIFHYVRLKFPRQEMKMDINFLCLF